MSITAEEIKVLNVDGTPYVVGDLPDNIQRLVEIYNTWRQQEIDTKIDLMKIEGAMRNMSGEIIQLVRAEFTPPVDEEAPADEAPSLVEVPADSDMDEVAGDTDADDAVVVEEVADESTEVSS